MSGNFYRVDHVPAVALDKYKKFVPRMLTRDLFAVANVVD